jgi:hypothetical protein
MRVTWASSKRSGEGLLALGFAMPMHGFRAGHPPGLPQGGSPATRAGHPPPPGRAPAVAAATPVARGGPHPPLGGGRGGPRPWQVARGGPPTPLGGGRGGSPASPSPGWLGARHPLFMGEEGGGPRKYHVGLPYMLSPPPPIPLPELWQGRVKVTSGLATQGLFFPYSGQHL